MGPNLANLIVFLLIGLVSGCLAGQVLKRRGFGVAGNMIVGVFGALVGGSLFNLIGVSVPGGALLGSIVTAAISAVGMLFSLGLLRQQTV